MEIQVLRVKLVIKDLRYDVFMIWRKYLTVFLCIQSQAYRAGGAGEGSCPTVKIINVSRAKIGGGVGL